MEIRIQRIFLNAFLLCVLATTSNIIFAAEEESEVRDDESLSNIKVFDPQVERREVDRDAIDTENWEVGMHYGIISIEDFGASEITSFTVAYHVTEDFFVSLNYGSTTAGESSFERLSGNVVLLTPEQREYNHYSFNLGFNLLPGEGFMGKDLAFTSSFYFLTGLGSTEFAGDRRSTVLLGGGYQVLFNDWLAMHVAVKDSFYDIELLGSAKTANDLEISTGFTIFF
jgi:outer membrane beta-barrel protein